MKAKNQTRNYKDTVFVDLFAKCPQARENFLSLYNALHGTSLTLKDTTVEPLMLEQTVYTGRYNDVSMLVDNRIIVLVEQQSTVNENMPLRFLEYISRLYEKLVPLEERYKTRQIALPEPCSTTERRIIPRRRPSVFPTRLAPPAGTRNPFWNWA